MSGIYGILEKHNRPLKVATLTGMQRPMEHWGPDGEGQWAEASIGLGHVWMREGLDPSFEEQPLRDSECSELALVADVRIDNRLELARELGWGPSQVDSATDSHLVLCAWKKWGTDSIARLQGAFSFVVWDRCEQTLFCVRDHIGFRPLFYYNGADRFVFATAVNALLAVPGVPQVLDEELLDAYYFLFHRHQLLAKSFFRNICKVPPAHMIVVRGGCISSQRWWFPENLHEVRMSSDDDYRCALNEHLLRAVECRLRTEHPIGVHLSGGLDSSVIAVIANRRLRSQGQKLAKGYTWFAPSQGSTDVNSFERSLIDLVCEQENLAYTETTLTADELLEDMSQNLSLEASDAQTYERVVCRQAAADGVRVLLSGWGGDEVASYTGRGYYAEQFLRGRWSGLLCDIMLQSGAEDAAMPRLRVVKRGLGTFVRQVCLPVLPDFCLGFTQSQVSRIQRKILDFLANQHGHHVANARQVIHDDWKRTWRLRPSVRRNQLGYIANGHITHRLESWACLAARHGMSYRYPLLDRRVMEFCLALPPEMYLHHGEDRFLFRYAAAQILPKVVWSAAKQNESGRLQALYSLTESIGLTEQTSCATASDSVPVGIIRRAELARRAMLYVRDEVLKSTQ